MRWSGRHKCLLSSEFIFLFIILLPFIIEETERVMEIKGTGFFFFLRGKIRHKNVPPIGPSSDIAPHISDDLQTVCFSLQAYREPVQEPLHPTGETLKPSSEISTENWKPKDLVRVQGKLSECSNACSPNSDARCSYPFLPYTFVILFGDWIPWCGNSYVHRKEEG